MPSWPESPQNLRETGRLNIEFYELKMETSGVGVPVTKTRNIVNDVHATAKKSPIKVRRKPCRERLHTLNND
jgi:hypothetical protein